MTMKAEDFNAVLWQLARSRNDLRWDTEDLEVVLWACPMLSDAARNAGLENIARMCGSPWYTWDESYALHA